jgi:hypothetical protein
MDCGTQDALCELTNWLSENEIIGPWLVEVIGRFGAHAEGVAGALAQFVRDYGQSIVGLIGVSFGFWRWWRYREHILHKRLAEYLRENDARLATGTADLIELIQRPAPVQQFKDPLFIDSDLRTVLRERNWDNATFALSVATSADLQLANAIDALKRRLSTAHAMTASLHRQLFSAYTIRGAIAASRAKRGASDESHSRALSYFRSALGLPGHASDVQLKELEAHQLRKLGLASAAEAYSEVMRLAKTIEDERQRVLTTARAKRYLSEVTRTSAPGHAQMMMRAEIPNNPFYPGAIPLISSFEPLNGWERLEKADMHYYTALGANPLRFVGIEQAQLNDAEAEYERIVSELSKRKWFRPRRYRRLRARALEGHRRVKEARGGSYDLNWLP